MIGIFSLISSFLLGVVFLWLGYIYVLTFASLFLKPRPQPGKARKITFAVAIPAHNEAEVIARTIATLKECDYPQDCVDIYIVADHCTDETVGQARQCGAVVYERDEGDRGKGPALSWLFRKIFDQGKPYDAIAIFDADTVVHPQFFKVMANHFAAGEQVVQGKHIIRNPQSGWFPMLTWAMFIIDNRFENLGGSNLGLSAKNMGDSICFSADVLQKFGWGSGLTEDFAFRQRLLLEGICIRYEPEAIGFGDAALNWKEASAQRQRWLRGAYLSSRQNARSMLQEGLKRASPALLDGAMYAYSLAYSTLTLLAAVLLIISLLARNWFWVWLPWAWGTLFILLFLFPLVNLTFERAPLKAFLVILTGPIFIVWRTWLSIYARFLRRQVEWVRTPRHIKDSHR